MSETTMNAARGGYVIRYEKIVRAFAFVFIACGAIGAIEPSPYDVTSVIACAVWFIGGFTLNRTVLPILFLWLAFIVAGFVALMPYWVEPDPVMYQLQTLYLIVTVFFFTLFFSENSLQRAELCFRAYTLGAVISAILGVLSYLDLFGLGVLMPYEGRAAGTFKDPNVFGSYMILAANYLLQVVLLRKGRTAVPAFGLLLTVLAGALVSFSRGSIGALMVSMTLVMGSGFLTTRSRALRKRIVIIAALVVILIVLTVAVLLTISDIRDFIIQRAALTQDYDEGVTGRFGNQLRSIPMLLERPLGFGPLRFRLIFALEPHNSFIGAFANDGWIGGFAWIAIVLSSFYVGIRMMFLDSPVRTTAQVFVPTLIVLVLQGFQIDIDHWRQLYLCFGAVWGLEAARRAWWIRQRQDLRNHARRNQIAETPA